LRMKRTIRPTTSRERRGRGEHARSGRAWHRGGAGGRRR
jgi:hypothetical protein